jgi:hypothetical protein
LPGSLFGDFVLTGGRLVVEPLNFDAPTPCAFTLWHRHGNFEHAVLERSFCFFRVDPFRQRDAPIKSAIAPFASLIAGLGFFVLLTPLALNRR